MRIGSLFSGYGGLDMAAAAVFGGELAWYSEIDKHACTVLKAHHPGIDNLGDVTAIDWESVSPVDILTAGYPCQPFSQAGNRKGQDDERHLWPYVATAIDALRPALVILENVRAHLTLGFGDVLADLSRVGYDAKWGVVRASDAGAPHARARVFIIAHPDGQGLEGHSGQEGAASPRLDGHFEPPTFGSAPYAEVSSGRQRRREQGSWETESGGQDCESATDTDECGRCQDVCQPGDISAQANERQSGFADGYRADGDASIGLSAPDTDRTGCEARVHAGRNCQRLRSQSMGPAPLAPDASGERHGGKQGSAVVGGMGVEAEGSGRQTSATRTQPDTGDAVLAADTIGQFNGTQSEETQSTGRRRSDFAFEWGKYGAAIDRWTAVLGRPAPSPTIPGHQGRPRLSPRFVEWMMGLPDGWVTGHGLKPAACLKMLGNGVVPQQAILALRLIMEGEA